MSFRDLRNFTEMMRALGYPRLISMENFRNPNFPLVAEIIIWLVKRFDPSSEIINDIETENDRVSLIRSAAQLLALKANLKLNTKKLYQADGYAVRELLKVTGLLYDALKSKETQWETEPDMDTLHVSPVEIAMKVDELKNSRQLVGEITSRGATLYDLLATEGELRELRNTRAARHLEMSQVEAAIKDSIKVVAIDIEKSKQMMESVSGNESTLDSKIEKKKADLERHQKRLQALKKVRPAFMEDFEKLEEELKILYSDYVTKCRNLSYLEFIHDQTEQAEQRRIIQKQGATRKIMEEMEQEEPSVKSRELFQDFMEADAKVSAVEEVRTRPERGKNRTAAGKGPEPKRVFGSMTGGDESDSLDDSDTDLLHDDDLSEDDDIEIDNGKQLKYFSDDEF